MENEQDFTGIWKTSTGLFVKIIDKSSRGWLGRIYKVDGTLSYSTHFNDKGISEDDVVGNLMEKKRGDEKGWPL